MKLSTRLLLLLGLCLLPMLAAQIYMREDLSRLHRNQLGVLALGQAEIANGDLDAILAEAERLAQVIGRAPGLDGAAGCGPAVTALRPLLAPYRFAAVMDATGRVTCTAGAPVPALTPLPNWAHATPDTLGFHVGLAQGAGRAGGFLPLSLILPDDDGHPQRVVVLGLDLAWLDAHLERFDLSATIPAGDGLLLVADRAGTPLTITPGPAGWLTPSIVPALRHLATAVKPGIANLRGADGQTRLVAYLPATEAPRGLMVAMVYRAAPLAVMIGNTAQRQTLLILAVVLLALTMILVAAQRYVVRPTADLLAAARRWQAGDFSARATRPGPAQEFRQLAENFNDMAATLGHRQRQQAEVTQSLTARAEERGRALSSTHDRLQVEIAEREKTEATLLQAQRLQTLGQLAGGIAHDFNNQLATIMGSLELLERRIPRTGGSEQAPIATLIERAIGAVQRGAQLTARMLVFSRRKRQSAQPIDLNRMIADLLVLAGSTLGRRVEVEAAPARDLWQAMADPSQVEAALLNLFLNARDAMPEGGRLIIRTGNAILAEETDDAKPGAYVQISVTDTGLGMSETVRSQAFEPFFTTKGTAGTGLGLSQVHGLARQSGGMVRIDSREREGTTVTLLLPRANGVEAEATHADAAPPAAAPVALSVLLVDDDDAVRHVTGEMLRDLGCCVTEAADGPAALALLADGAKPGLLMLDYAMPGMNGLELASAARAYGLTVPIVMITGYAEFADNMGHAFDALMRKPFTIADLQRLLEQLRIASVRQADATS